MINRNIVRETKIAKIHTPGSPSEAVTSLFLTNGVTYLEHAHLEHQSENFFFRLADDILRLPTPVAISACRNHILRLPTPDTTSASRRSASTNHTTVADEKESVTMAEPYVDIDDLLEVKRAFYVNLSLH